jgi:hypothetical protein
VQITVNIVELFGRLLCVDLRYFGMLIDDASLARLCLILQTRAVLSAAS